MLAKTEMVVFDKTGTLTKGRFQVTAIHPTGASASNSCWSWPPGGVLVRTIPSPLPEGGLGQDLDTARVGVEELSGRGVREGGRQEVCAGNGKLMEEIGWPAPSGRWAPRHVAPWGGTPGHIVISDEVKPDAKRAIAALKAQGVKKTVMLTGDAKDGGRGRGPGAGPG